MSGYSSKRSENGVCLGFSPAELRTAACFTQNMHFYLEKKKIFIFLEPPNNFWVISLKKLSVDIFLSEVS